MVRKTGETSAEIELGPESSGLRPFLRGVLVGLALSAAAAAGAILMSPPPADLPTASRVEVVGAPPAATPEQVAEAEPFSVGEAGEAPAEVPPVEAPAATSASTQAPADETRATEAPVTADPLAPREPDPTPGPVAAVEPQAPKATEPESAPAEAPNADAPVQAAPSGAPALGAPAPVSPAPGAPAPAAGLPPAVEPGIAEPGIAEPVAGDGSPGTELAIAPDPAETPVTAGPAPGPAAGAPGTVDAAPAAPPSEPAAPATLAPAEAGTGLAANAREFDAPRDAPLLAVVLVGDGGTLRADRLDLLTMPLTIAIPPDAAGAATLGEAARAAGHEVLADLPLRGEAPDVQLAALDMAVGATSTTGRAEAGALSPVMGELDRQGLAWVDTGIGISTPAERIARELGLPYTQGNRSVGGNASPEQIYRAIDAAAHHARQWGTSVLFLEASEPALQALVRWGLEQRGDNPVWFAPISAVIQRRGG